MATKCLLFAYGQLQPGHNAPRSLSDAWPDRARGVLYDLGAYPGAVQLDTADTWVEGHTLEIDADELPALDEFEDVDSGEYRRITVTTEAGHMAWAYEYGGEIPAGATPITRWRKAGA
jgi:gamma-glutamylcyclotransferase (GGCT)/AIG2-like uncharacterized protein YtfP